MNDNYDYEKEVWKDKRKKIIVMKSPASAARVTEFYFSIACELGLLKRSKKNDYSV